MNYVIYKITNILNNKIYVGSAKDFHVRKLKHLNFLRNGKHHCIHLQYAYNQYGENAFEFSIIEIVENATKLIEREQYWLDITKCYVREIGYNISPTAGNTLGTKRTPDQRLKLSASQRGHKHTEQTKLKWSEQRTGKSHSPEAIENMRKSKKEMSRWSCPDGCRCKCEKCLPIIRAERNLRQRIKYHEKTKYTY